MKLLRTISAISDFISKTVETLETWRLHQKSSMEFACVDTHILQDIYISDAWRFTEINKPF